VQPKRLAETFDISVEKAQELLIKSGQQTTFLLVEEQTTFLLTPRN
jgi:hypothetical protein